MKTEHWRRVVLSPWWFCVPFAAVVVSCLSAVAGRRWLLTGDFAHTEFLVRMVPSEPPLVGVAARVRDAGSTPGPSMAYLLAPLYRLLGGSSWALAASVGALHVAGAAGTMWLTRSLAGRRAAACVACALFVAARSFGPEFFLQPWNVWVPVFAFPFFLVALWAASDGRYRWLPVAAAVGSHCVQTHISYTVLVAGMLAAVAALVALRWWRDRSQATAMYAIGWTCVVGVVVWLPPLIEQWQTGTGNLRKVFDQFTSPGEAAVGFGAGARAMAGRLNLFGPWLSDPLSSPESTPNWWGFMGFVALVGYGVRCAWQRRQLTELRWYAVLSGVTSLGVLSASRVFGVFFEYVVRWMVPLAALWIGTAVWSVWRSRHRWTLNDTRAEPHVAIAVVLAATTVGVLTGVGAQLPYETDSTITYQLIDEMIDELPADTRFRIEEHDVVALGSVAYGLHLALEKSGRRDGVGEWGRAGVKSHRVVDEASADGDLWYVSGQPVIDAYAALPGARIVAQFDPRNPEQARRSDTLLSQLLAELCAAGRDDLRHELFVRWGFARTSFGSTTPASVKPLVDELIALRQPTAVVLTPVGAASDVVVSPPPC